MLRKREEDYILRLNMYTYYGYVNWYLLVK